MFMNNGMMDVIAKCVAEHWKAFQKPITADELQHAVANALERACSDDEMFEAIRGLKSRGLIDECSPHHYRPLFDEIANA